MNDYFDFSQMQDWLANQLKSRGITRPSQILYMTEEQLRVNGILTVGIIRNLSVHLEERGIFFRNGRNSIIRLHLHRNGLWQLINNGVTELSDLEAYTKDELVWDLGFDEERADFIEKRMQYWGHSLREY